MQKRFSAGLLALFLILSSGGAFALIPLIPGVVPLATYLGATAELATAVDWSLALHAAVLSIALKPSGGAATSGTSAPLTVKLNPKDPLPTPAGWTAAPAGQVQPVPPASAIQTPGGYCAAPCTVPTASTAQAAADAYVATYGGFNAGVAFNGSSFTWCSSSSCGSVAVVYLNYISATCPAGYVVTGTSCAVNNPSAVMKPSNGNCQIMRVGNSYSVDSQNPDCATGSPTINPTNVTITPSYVSVVNSSNGSTANSTINADGTTTVQECYPDVASNSTKCMSSKFSSPDATTGKVTFEGQSTTTAPGIGSGVGAATAGISATGGMTDATGQQLLGKLNAQDTAATNAAASNPALPVDPASVSALGLPSSNPFSSALPSSINSLVPSNSENCVSLDVALPYMSNLHIDPCPVVSVIRPMMNYLIISLGVIGGIFFWLKADGGGEA